MNGLRIDGLILAVVGGDEREREIARLAADAGARVRAFGFPWPSEGIEGVIRTVSAEEALDGARYALFPIPGLATDGSLFAPSSLAPIVPDVALLGHLAREATIILGIADEALRRSAASLGLTVIEYEDDQELMLRRGPAIVEGAIGLAIANTDITLHDATVAVVGHGTVGRLLAQRLVALSAHVHVFARNPIQRADAYTAGCQAHPLEELIDFAPQLDVLISTASARVVDRDVLSALAPRRLVMDLSAPPGSVDLSAALDLGHRALWARGLGRRAPVSVGRSQWDGVIKRIIESEEKRSEG